ncbi:hypothetical protein Hamer_G023800 [Homarus americanus]|uniref:Uncharacterized protein n=1 Tax=Homarus americanus TaxID=6706 RepID=A0A8J5ML90_HOMAM|nr:hypothetical protein Hamer_G023800 [Homarus americanus]
MGPLPAKVLSQPCIASFWFGLFLATVTLHTMWLRRIRRSDAGLHVRHPTGLVRYGVHCSLQTVDNNCPKLGRCTRQPDECAAENSGLSGATKNRIASGEEGMCPQEVRTPHPRTQHLDTGRTSHPMSTCCVSHPSLAFPTPGKEPYFTGPAGEPTLSSPSPPLISQPTLISTPSPPLSSPSPFDGKN